MARKSLIKKRAAAIQQALTMAERDMREGVRLFQEGDIIGTFKRLARVPANIQFAQLIAAEAAPGLRRKNNVTKDELDALLANLEHLRVAFEALFYKIEVE